MNNVFKKQNENESILQLMAVRRLYSNAKFVNKVNFLLSVILPVVISVSKIILDKLVGFDAGKWIPYLGYYGIAVLIFTIITSGRVSQLKKKAATIQEMFDCDVLSIRWNDIKVGKKVSVLEIHKYAKFYVKKNSHNMFKCWYFQDDYPFNKNVSALLCQNENVGWDLSQRYILNKILITIIVMSLLLLLFYGFYYDLKISEFLFYVVFLLPLFRHFYLQFKENTSSIEKSTRLNESIEKAIEDFFYHDAVDENEFNYIIRAIQDEIFSHRVSNLPIPDFLHKFFRSKNEEEFKQHFDYYLNKMKGAF